MLVRRIETNRKHKALGFVVSIRPSLSLRATQPPFDSKRQVARKKLERFLSVSVTLRQNA